MPVLGRPLGQRPAAAAEVVGACVVVVVVAGGIEVEEHPAARSPTAASVAARTSGRNDICLLPNRDLARAFGANGWLRRVTRLQPQRRAARGATPSRIGAHNGQGAEALNKNRPRGRKRVNARPRVRTQFASTRRSSTGCAAGV